MADKDFDRLLVCKTHGVMWKMRPYDGPPEYDQELRELCDRHNAQVPNPQDCRALIYRTDADTASKLDIETAKKRINEVVKCMELVVNRIDSLKK